MGDKEWWRIVGNHREQIKLFEIKGGKKFFNLGNNNSNELYSLDFFTRDNGHIIKDVGELVNLVLLGFLTKDECEETLNTYNIKGENWALDEFRKLYFIYELFNSLINRTLTFDQCIEKLQNNDRNKGTNLEVQFRNLYKKKVLG